MSGSLIPNAKQQYLDANGNPLAGGFVYYYIPGTTTFKNTYQNAALTILNSNPIILDSAGECIAYGVGSFRQIVTDVNGNLIWDQPTLSLLTNDAATVIYNEGASTAVSRTVQNKLQESISVKDFGAVGDGVTDDTAAIQAAIDWAVYQNQSSGGFSLGSVFMPGGIYKISNTLQLGYGESFHSVFLYGDGKRFNNGASIGNGFCGTGIITTFNNAPAIAVNGGRGTTIKDLSIMGLNYNWVVSNNLGAYTTPTINDLIASNWVDSSFPASSSSRYAPYCAIAIDPYAGTQPIVHYPNVTFPSWSGITTQYNKAYSSDTLIENVYINGFVAGVVNQPCDADGNGDYTKIINSQINCCQYAVSIGNTQSRLVKLNNVYMSQVYCGISTGIYGRELGKPQILLESCEISTSIYAMNVTDTSYGCNVTFLNCYAEVLYSLGNGSTGVSLGQSPIVFENCEFSFSSWLYRGIPAYIFKTVYGSVVFRNTNLTAGTTPSPNIFYINAPSDLVVIDNCVVDAGYSATYYYQKYAINATGGIVANNAGVSFSNYSVLPKITWNLNSGGNITPVYISNSTSKTNRTYCIPLYSKNVRAATAGEAGFLNNPAPNTLDKTLAVTLTSSTNIVTVDFTGIYTASYLIQNGGEVGDVVVDGETGAVFFVSARTGAVLTLTAQTGLTVSGNLAQAPTKSGYFYILNCRTYTPYFVTLGDTTSGNATISNFQRPDGYSAYINDPDNGVQVNDYVYVGSGQNVNPTSSTGAKITAIGANSITLNSTMNFTDAHIRQQIFIRQAPANNT
jgi:hypothetical protein